MPEKQFTLTTQNGVIGAAALVVVVLVRFATLGDSDDPKLLEAIRAELRNDLGGQIGHALEELSTDHPDAADAVAYMVGDNNIRIYAASVSKPVLSFSSSAKAIVKIDYELPQGSRQTAYWRFTDSVIGGWQYRAPSSVVSYYLNLF